MGKYLLKVVFAFIVLSTFSFAKPTIYILATGGTIAGSSSDSLSGAYKSGSISVDSLINAVPKIKELADIKGEQVVNISSNKVDSEILLTLSKRVNEILALDEVDGVLITHGTDTIEESAYFLNLTAKSDKPVVILGAMRPATSLSSDGALNIFNAVSVAINKESIGKGVLLVMNDEIHLAREVTKSNTTNTFAFTSPNTGKIGIVNYGDVDFYTSSLRTHTKNSEFDIKNLKSLPEVEIIYSYTGGSGDLIDMAVKNGAKGIVVAGSGSGSLYPKIEKALANATQNGVVVVRSSRVGSGTTSVGTGVEVYDKKYGFVSSDTLNPQKARILLMLALTKTNDPKEIQKMFKKY